MLSATRKKLTIVYTMVFGLFLLAFTAIVCFVLIWGTYVERTEEIGFLAHQIERDQLDLIVQQSKKPGITPQDVPIEDDYDISGQVFYYIFNPKNQLIKADAPVPVLRDVVYHQIMTWVPSDRTKFATVTLPSGDTAVLILTTHQVHQGGDFLATVYVGKDVTAYARALVRSILTLTGTAFLFLILAAAIGYFIAGKITIPMEQLLKRKKQFIADASHELRTPLSVLFTSVEAIEMDTDNVLSPFSLQIMSDAKDEFFRLRRLVNDLLTLARADTGDIKLNKEIFSLNLVTEQVIYSLQTAANQKRINIRFDKNESIELNADPERIHQLLYILIDNGLKYSSPNSEISIQLKRIQTGTTPFVKIVVTDTGPGIPSKFQKQIFQPFFRIDESRSRTIEGSGLGLSIAQWIVDAHKGEINVTSEGSGGSHFIVLIPNC